MKMSAPIYYGGVPPTPPMKPRSIIPASTNGVRVVNGINSGSAQPRMIPSREANYDEAMGFRSKSDIVHNNPNLPIMVHVDKNLPNSSRMSGKQLSLNAAIQTTRNSPEKVTYC